MAGAAEKWDLSTRLITLKSPNWRARALPLLEPVNARSPGVDAWLMSKENAVVLLAQLRNRTDFSEHYAMHQPLDTGQSHKIQRYRDRDYVRSVRWAHRQFGAVRPERDAIAEGYTLQISPLFDPADRLIDAVVKCQIDQVEQFVPVTLTVNGANNQKQRVNIEVPQIVSWRLHERFVWPQDKVLLLSCGVVAAPTKDSKGRFPLPTANGRADALLFIQSNGTVGEALRGLERGDRTARQPGGFNRRY